MYTLYYLNKNLQMGTLKVASLDAPVLIPENLIFSNIRRGINFIKEPNKCVDFTDLERLIISSEFFDSSLVNEADFRRANTYLTPLCPIELPLILDIVYTDRALWSYPYPVVVLRCDTPVGTFVPINGTDGASTFTNMAMIEVNETYFVMLKDAENGQLSNILQHYMPT
ncbi:hypothetical protein [Flavobacterium sp. PL02]|uniref:hypothetical protein n=1 Tax=Flavobacterium sp. PL02 TaxID=3088354 RepID=UPI002B23E347|nr:hypothetical protein [Flavobacterium sp. PL02]MEA9415911.1 hypothetical protein [Flavobacterium sp. PL02]